MAPRYRSRRLTRAAGACGRTGRPRKHTVTRPSPPLRNEPRAIRRLSKWLRRFHSNGSCAIGFVTPHYGFYGDFYGPFYGFNGRYGYPYHYGPYRGPEGGLNPIQARLMGWGAIDVHVKPSKAEVWVDGNYVGTARELDGHPSYLWLEEGNHRVTIYRGGFVTYDERRLDLAGSSAQAEAQAAAR